MSRDSASPSGAPMQGIVIGVAIVVVAFWAPLTAAIYRLVRRR